MRQTILVTGLNGWTGYYLSLCLLQKAEAEIVGLGLNPQLAEPLQPFASRIRYYQCDLTTSTDGISAVLNKEHIDGVVHLAALTTSMDWSALLRVNVLGTVNLCSALS